MAASQRGASIVCVGPAAEVVLELVVEDSVVEEDVILDVVLVFVVVLFVVVLELELDVVDFVVVFTVVEQAYLHVSLLCTKRASRTSNIF